MSNSRVSHSVPPMISIQLLFQPDCIGGHVSHFTAKPNIHLPPCGRQTLKWLFIIPSPGVHSFAQYCPQERGHDLRFSSNNRIQQWARKVSEDISGSSETSLMTCVTCKNCVTTMLESIFP